MCIRDSSPSRSAGRPSAVGFSCVRVVLAQSLASTGVRGNTTYDISVSPSDSVVPEGCVSSYRLSGVFHTP
eukprot:14898637-Alexandrium_andersonii.AAC.1